MSARNSKQMTTRVPTCSISRRVFASPAQTRLGHVLHHIKWKGVCSLLVPPLHHPLSDSACVPPRRGLAAKLLLRQKLGVVGADSVHTIHQRHGEMAGMKVLSHPQCFLRMLRAFRVPLCTAMFRLLCSSQWQSDFVVDDMQAASGAD